MENTRQFNPDLGNIAWSAIIIDKVHRCTDCPIRQMAMKRPRSIFARLHAWHTNLVAGLESPPGEGVRLQRQGKGSSLKESFKIRQYIGVKMENTRKSNIDFSAIAWGAFFILWGITEMFKSLPDGTGTVGIGVILLGLNLARSWKGQPISGFTTTLGVLALLLGGLQLARPFLHLSFELPIFAILLMVLGLIVLAGELKGSKNHG